MIVLSALLHALILFVILFSPSLPTPKRTFGPAYSVDLVSMPASDPGARPARIPFSEDIGVTPRDTSVVARRTVEAAPVVPIERIRVQRREAPAQVDDAIRQIEERLAAAKGTETPSPRGTPQPPARESGAREDRMSPYYSALWVKIKEQWALPEVVHAGERLEAVLAVTIRRDGTMERFSFERRSGNRLFDESVEKAVQKASPFPALPGWLNEPYIDVGIRFHSSEYQ
jgi:TonB family protein